MADPTMKDVLDAIVRIERGQVDLRADMATKKDVARLEKGQAEIHSDIDAVRDGVDALRSDVDAGFAAVGERFDALDKKLDVVRGVIRSTREDARDLRTDLNALHKGLARAKLPGVPADLPSEVRAKGTKASKPAAKRVTAKPRRR